MSVAALMSPCSFLMFDSILVMRARSTSTKIYKAYQYSSHVCCSTLTLPSVTVRNVSMTDSFVSRFGVSSKKPMTVWTILVVACFNCPCFFESSRTCSFIRFQSLARLAIVTMEIMIREVDARSEALGRLANGGASRHLGLVYLASLLLQSKQLVDTGLWVALLISR
jgi:hypothetical protein